MIRAYDQTAPRHAVFAPRTQTGANGLYTRRRALMMPQKLCLICLIGFVLISGCAVKPPLPTQEKPPTALEEQAARMWQAQNYARSLRLYQELLQTQDLDQETQRTAWRRVSRSALELGRFERAVQSLRQWAQVDPKTRENWTWHELYTQALGETEGAQKAREHLHTVAVAPNTVWSVRRPAAERLTTAYWQQGSFARFAAVQSAVHQAASTPEQRKLIESSLLETVQDAPEAQWQNLLDQIGPLGPKRYPHNILQWVWTRRQLAEERIGWAAAWHRLEAVVRGETLALTPVFRETLDALRQEYGTPEQEIGLLVPLSGSYARFGRDIVRGASAAQWQISRHGGKITVHVINTAAENWQHQLNRLPENIQLIGGPLRQSSWKAITQLAPTKRAFFTFLSSLPASTEGRQAWRFFASTADQSRALVKAASALGIDKIAILYPQETFGRRMAASFWEQSRQHNATITGLAHYLPDAPTRWSGTVGDFLRVPDKETSSETTGEGNQTARPEPDFGAVFLPDTLSKAQLMVPNFFYHDEDRLLFLGPRLWSQALARGADLEQRYFRLALTPGAWSPGMQRTGLDALRQELEMSGLPGPNFWSGLGYDFVRFAARFDDPAPGFTADELNSRLHAFSGFSWALAPIQWDREGHARQDLFVFQPVSGGLRPANLDALGRRLERTKKAHAARRQARNDSNSTQPKEQTVSSSEQ
ncbi:conserved hypothetical protein [Desulfohalobium retbaense DSM 5692]|uniref:Leucine-binding protein domain-containing protein n=2 Tax=Desulfohalobium TaxID=45662 RepID=C8WZX9_DESRD|nr:conserved hypothetical protein [Desulfohalobium retbaense DSM 5692]